MKPELIEPVAGAAAAARVVVRRMSVLQLMHLFMDDHRISTHRARIGQVIKSEGPRTQGLLSQFQNNGSPLIRLFTNAKNCCTQLTFLFFKGISVVFGLLCSIVTCETATESAATGCHETCRPMRLRNSSM